MATDINCNWESNRDKVLLRNSQCLEQAVSNALFFDRDDVYWGRRNEIGLSRYLFEFNTVSDFMSLKDLAVAIKDFDKRLTLNQNRSSIQAVGDQMQLRLEIQYAYGPTLHINQTVERT
jgi:hypothetical protein